MSEEQKEPYKKKYADWKGQTRNDYMETLSVTSDSSSYSNIFDPKKQQYDFRFFVRIDFKGNIFSDSQNFRLFVWFDF